MTRIVMLCFRDLVTAPGDTIRQHRQIIDAHGHCWWGWWMKPIEVVPTDVLRAYLRDGVSRFGRAATLLYDCGQYELNIAGTTDVAFGPGGIPMRSPEPQLTPEYYVHVKCACWLKFDVLHRLPESKSLLQDIVYDGLPSWPDQTKADGVVGRHIRDFVELDEMAVTFWSVLVPDRIAAEVSTQGREG